MSSPRCGWISQNTWRKLVPGEGIEPPAFGLQNRCTTAVLTRRVRKKTQGRCPWTPPRAEPLEPYSSDSLSGFSVFGPLSWPFAERSRSTSSITAMSAASPRRIPAFSTRV